MATDATGTPTSPDSIPTYATSGDAPSGKGFNAAMAVIQTALSARWLKSLFTTTGDIAYASAASTPARLGIGSTGNVLTVAGGVPTWAAPASALVNYRKTTPKTVNNTGVTTDLFNGEITVGAGVMGSTGGLRVTAWGDFLNNVGSTAFIPRWALLFGGTTLIDTSNFSGIANLSARDPWMMRATILNLTASTQVVHFELSISSNGGVTATGVPLNTGSGNYYAVGAAFAKAEGVNTGAVNTALAQALVFNVTNGSTNALYETKLLGALVEVI